MSVVGTNLNGNPDGIAALAALRLPGTLCTDDLPRRHPSPHVSRRHPRVRPGTPQSADLRSSLFPPAKILIWRE